VLPGAVIVRLSAVSRFAVLVDTAIYARPLGLPALVALALSAEPDAASLLALSCM
jgi:hypothetical protein